MIICKRPVPPDYHGWQGRGGHQGDRGDHWPEVSVTWCEEGGEGEGEEILAGRRHMDQPKVVQEVLADLKNKRELDCRFLASKIYA